MKINLLMKTEFTAQSRQTLSAGGWGLGTRLVSLRLTEQPYFAKLNFKAIISALKGSVTASLIPT